MRNFRIFRILLVLKFNEFTVQHCKYSSSENPNENLVKVFQIPTEYPYRSPVFDGSFLSTGFSGLVNYPVISASALNGDTSIYPV